MKRARPKAANQTMVLLVILTMTPAIQMMRDCLQDSLGLKKMPSLTTMRQIVKVKMKFSREKKSQIQSREGQGDQGQEESPEELGPEEDNEPTVREREVLLINSETGTMYKEIYIGELNFSDGYLAVGYDSFYPSEDYFTIQKIFISFDISSLSGATIQDAVLSLGGCTVYGDPSYFKNMYINIINWGPGQPPFNFFDSAGIVVPPPYPSSSDGNIRCNSVELLNGLQNAINNNNSRFQLRLHFSGTLKNTYFNIDDLWHYKKDNVMLNIKYTQ